MTITNELHGDSDLSRNNFTTKSLTVAPRDGKSSPKLTTSVVEKPKNLSLHLHSWSSCLVSVLVDFWRKNDAVALLFCLVIGLFAHAPTPAATGLADDDESATGCGQVSCRSREHSPSWGTGGISLTSLISSGASLDAGRTYSFPLERTLADLTTPSSLVTTSNTRSKGHRPRSPGSGITTTSLGAKFSLSWDHFFLGCCVVRNSFIRRCQTCDTRYSSFQVSSLN